MVQIDKSGATDLKEIGTENKFPSWLQPVFQRYLRSIELLETEPAKASQRFIAALLAKLPYAIFFLVHGFALFTRLLYRRRGRSYTEHLLFALHLHAFVFLYLTAMQLLPGDALLGIMIPVWWLYLTLALRRVFGGRWIAQWLRSLTLILGHSVLLTAVLLVALVLAVPSIA